MASDESQRRAFVVMPFAPEYSDLYAYGIVAVRSSLE